MTASTGFRLEGLLSAESSILENNEWLEMGLGGWCCIQFGVGGDIKSVALSDLKLGNGAFGFYNSAFKMARF
jgi:hypothetical protein